MESFLFPFIGSLENGETFEYLLLSLNKDDAEIAITNWLVNRVKLNLDAKIELFIPLVHGHNFNIKKSNSGIVASVAHNEELQGDVYRIKFESEGNSNGVTEHSLNELIHKQFMNTSQTELLIYLIKDLMLLKQGVKIYLKHLIPYFSRVVNYTQVDYAQLKEYLLKDVMERIINNENKLEKLYRTVRNHLVAVEEIPIYINLEDLREIAESEILEDLFNIMFSERIDLTDSETVRTQTNYGFTMFIKAIKALEKRIFINYNYIVIIYLNSLKSA